MKGESGRCETRKSWRLVDGSVRRRMIWRGGEQREEDRQEIGRQFNKGRR